MFKGGGEHMQEKIYYNGFLAVLISLGLLFLKSGFEKVSGGKFVVSLNGTLTKFASENPNGWYKQLLQSTFIPNAQILGMLIMWGEIVTAVLLVVSGIILMVKPTNKMAEWTLLAGLLGGISLNLNFYFAAGWTSPSTATTNLLMVFIEVIAIVVYSIVIFKK